MYLRKNFEAIKLSTHPPLLTDGAVNKQASTNWSAMSAADKHVYEAENARLKAKYHAALVASSAPDPGLGWRQDGAGSNSSSSSSSITGAARQMRGSGSSTGYDNTSANHYHHQPAKRCRDELNTDEPAPEANVAPFPFGDGHTPPHYAGGPTAPHYEVATGVKRGSASGISSSGKLRGHPGEGALPSFPTFAPPPLRTPTPISVLRV